MSNLAYASDILTRLTRLNNELTRRNGYTDLSVNTPVTIPVEAPTATEELIKVQAINTILIGLRFINENDVPVNRVANESFLLDEDLTTIDALLTTFEAQPRGERTNNDCTGACAGMCITECTTGCISCTSCSGCTSCTSCTGCTGCTGTCTKHCNWTCTGGCSSCSGCTGCKGCSGCSSVCRTTSVS